MSSSVLPTPETITHATVRKCVDELYPLVLRNHYTKKSKKNKSLEKAIEDDEWRYTTLPELLKSSTGAKTETQGQEEDKKEVKGLSLSQLSRLVEWKISHGEYRPFLPSMIRKNSLGEVATASEKSQSIVSKLGLSSPSSTSSALSDSHATRAKMVRQALDEICQLKGVGPATGTLVLSVFDSAGSTPFFEDELYLWLCADGRRDGKKLKYDMKEYFQLYEKLSPLLARLGVKAWEVEKTAFVLMHTDLLRAEEKEGLASSTDVGNLKELEDGKGEDVVRHNKEGSVKESRKRKVRSGEIPVVPERPLQRKKAAVKQSHLEVENQVRRSSRTRT